MVAITCLLIHGCINQVVLTGVVLTLYCNITQFNTTGHLLDSHFMFFLTNRLIIRMSMYYNHFCLFQKLTGVYFSTQFNTTSHLLQPLFQVPFHFLLHKNCLIIQHWLLQPLFVQFQAIILTRNSVVATLLDQVHRLLEYI